MSQSVQIVVFVGYFDNRVIGDARVPGDLAK